MKPFLILLLFLVSVTGSAQTIKAYEAAMEKIKDFYNNGHADSLRNLISDNSPDTTNATNGSLAYWKMKYGNLYSSEIRCTRIDGLVIFKDIFLQPVRRKNSPPGKFHRQKYFTGLLLNKDSKLLVFKMFTSPYLSKAEHALRVTAHPQ